MNGNRVKLDILIGQLKEMWAGMDTLYQNIKPDEWSTPHGADWVFADVPFHMVYCEIELVADVMDKGLELPKEKQVEALNFAKLGAWNDEQFAKRPNDLTPQQSLADLKAVQERILDSLGPLDDSDLTRPVWLITPFSMGWRNLEFLLKWDILHNWMEFIQLRYLMGRDDPEMSALTTHTILNSFMWLYPVLLDREVAKSSKFNFVSTISGDSGGSWTIAVENGTAVVRVGRPERVDLEMIQSIETFSLVLLGKVDPGEAIQSGAIQVIHSENLPTLGRLFPAPEPDKNLTPVPLDVMI